MNFLRHLKAWAVAMSILLSIAGMIKLLNIGLEHPEIAREVVTVITAIVVVAVAGFFGYVSTD